MKRGHVPVVVVLETMHGEVRAASPAFFRINPNNFSGKRLHYLIGHSNFLVTNACREYVATAKEHGTPDPERLAKNLQRVDYDLLLVCGNVAIKTFEECGYIPPSAVVLPLRHPAARTWTKQSLAVCKTLLEMIQNAQKPVC